MVASPERLFYGSTRYQTSLFVCSALLNVSSNPMAASHSLSLPMHRSLASLVLGHCVFSDRLDTESAPYGSGWRRGELSRRPAVRDGGVDPGGSVMANALSLLDLTHPLDLKIENSLRYSLAYVSWLANLIGASGVQLFLRSSLHFSVVFDCMRKYGCWDLSAVAWWLVLTWMPLCKINERKKTAACATGGRCKLGV